MKLVFLFAFISCYIYLNDALSLKEPIVKHLWKAFKETHEKLYLTQEHESLRLGIFTKNLDLIEKHNSEYSMGLHSFELGVNFFADWTIEEFRQKMLGTRLNLTHTRKGSSGVHLRLLPSITLPDEIDWRTEGAVTPVKNQGECGSCWAFSTTGSLESAHFRATGKLVSLSEQQLVDCSGKFNNEGCNGGLMDNAFEYIKSIGGLDTEESYPYHAKQEKCHFKKDKVAATCSGYVDIPTGDEDALKEAVATQGAVSVAIDVTEDKFMFYKSGVFVDKTCSNGQDDLNHGVLVVGYGADNSTKGEPADYWTVKNSWGTKWGEEGYIRMARNHNNMCGISTSASYPLVKQD